MVEPGRVSARRFETQGAPLHSPAQFRSGLIYGIVAYCLWGLVPLYFREIREVPAGEILAHRIAWCVPLLMLLTAVTPGGFAALGRVLGSRKLVLTLLLSGSLLAGNWLLYIFASIHGRVAEASLGYYMLPLVNAFLGTVFLGERLRPAHFPALALIVVGVSFPLILQGQFPWLALALPITFGFYGFVRKRIPVDSSTGLTTESLLILGPCIGYLFFREARGAGSFGPDSTLNGLLMFSGLVTVVPLLTYTLSIRRLPLIAQSLIQFISPSIQFLIAVVLLKEEMGLANWAAIVCVWISVAVFIADALHQERKKRRKLLQLATPDLVGVDCR
jgi:chloramphenicol-sensitive protein RarD